MTNPSRRSMPSIVLCLLAASAAFAGGGVNSNYIAVIDGKEVSCPPIPMGDDNVVHAILEEGKHHNQVMDRMRYLTQEIGPRLTGSSNAEKANRWALSLYQQWGLDNAHLEEWGTIPVRFDRAPSTGKVLLVKKSENSDGSTKIETEPGRDMEFTTMAWAWGTNGAVQGPVIREPQTEAEYAACKDKLKGAWVLIPAPAPVGQRGIRSIVGARYEMRIAARKKVAEGTDPKTMTIAEQLSLEPVAGYISTSSDERVWTGAVPKWRELTMESIPHDTHVVVRRSDYDFMNSRLADGESLVAEFNLDNRMTAGPTPCYNTVAEIRGTEWPDQVVIISAHADSWNGPGSQGCTDNGTGTVVTLEAARILAAVHAHPKRTIRFVNWTGEEQGLLGSHGYVEMHKAELPNISAVFVDDGGTNTEGGLPAAANEVEMLAAATAPTNNQFYSQVDQKYLNVNVRNTGNKIDTHGSSDHASFNQVGVPGFFWDEIGRADYGFGWHTQNDKLELAIPEYLVQSSTNAAITAYRLACADTLLPRVPLDVQNKPAVDVRPARPTRADSAKPAPAKPASTPK